MDAAINHYIEAGKSFKAIEAAIGAKQVNFYVYFMLFFTFYLIELYYSNSGRKLLVL